MGGAGKSRQMNIPLGTDIWTVLTQPIITGVYKTYALMFEKARFRKTSDAHPCLTEFSKTHGEAMIFLKKEDWL